MVSEPSICSKLYSAKKNLCMRGSGADETHAWYSLESVLSVLANNRDMCDGPKEGCPEKG